MKWMLERDALIAQTMAFVQSVTGRKDAGEPLPLAAPEVAPAPMPPPLTGEPAPASLTATVELPPPSAAVAAAPPLQISSTVPRPMVPGDFQREIKTRVASFRAHQERFNREREEYFSETLARLRASIKDAPPPPPPGPRK